MPKRYVVVPIAKNQFIHADKESAVQNAKMRINKNQTLRTFHSKRTGYMVAELVVVAAPKQYQVEIEIQREAAK
jgi:hypothetical protein